MAYSLGISLALGSSQTGLTLSAQLVNTTGANVGSAVTSGFTEIGAGNYLWYYTGFPDGFVGGVKFSAASVLKAFVDVALTTLGPTGLDQVLVGGMSLPTALEYIGASTAGKVSGAGTGTEHFTGLDGVTARLIVACDALGNRTGVTYL